MEEMRQTKEDADTFCRSLRQVVKRGQSSPKSKQLV